jgi:hypothetical protein
LKEKAMAEISEVKQINRHGTVTITQDGISVEGFEFFNSTCRDGAILAAAWAIGELQREMFRAIQRPGDSHIYVD